MKILSASVLALALVAGSGSAVAQTATTFPYDAQDFDDGRSAGYPGEYRDDDGHYDYARVIRVVPA